MKKDYKPDKKDTAIKRDLAMIRQGIIVWFLLIIVFFLVWVVLYFSTKLIGQIIAPAFKYHTVLAILAATIISFVLLLFFTRK